MSEGDKFERDLDEWLRQANSEGRYHLKGLISGWSIVIDCLKEDGEPGHEGFYHLNSAPGQRPTMTIGLHQAALFRHLGSYIGQGIQDLEEEDGD